MRNAFIKALTVLAQRDQRVILATGDLGFKVFDEYRKQCGAQYVNVGVAEASLIGMGAGMAMEGQIPFVYSIASFLVMRPFEQIRNDIAFHNANVKLVGVGGGFSYGPNGPSHHALTDVALMRLLPEMTVLTPGDTYEALWAIENAYAHKGPVYIRLGRGGEGGIHQQKLDIAIGRSILIQEGQGIAIFASGLMLKNALGAAEVLRKKGIMARVVSFPSVKPLDEVMIKETFKNFNNIFTIEEHSHCGGFGSAVAEFAIACQLPVQKLRIIAAPQETVHLTGSHEYLRCQAGLSADKIAQNILTTAKDHAHTT